MEQLIYYIQLSSPSPFQISRDKQLELDLVVFPCSRILVMAWESDAMFRALPNLDILGKAKVQLVKW